MQSTREAIRDSKHSITAVAIAMGYARGLDTDYLYLFTPLELTLSKHFFFNAKRHLPWSVNWLKASTLSLMSYSRQRAFCNTKIAPGYDGLITLRKLMIKQKVANAVHNGVEQIVFLGGGHDIRSLLTAVEHPNIQIYEMDRGPTREAKVDSVISIPRDLLNLHFTYDFEKPVMRVNNNLHLIDCDLAVQDLREVLCQNGFNPAKKTLIIAEGLTVYLSEHANAKLLFSIFDLFKDGDELLISYMSKIVTNETQKQALDEAGELYDFPLAPESVIPFAATHGLEVSRRFSAYDLLGSIGDNESVTFYRNNPERGKELYYLMNKSSVRPDAGKKLADVPLIECAVQPRALVPVAAALRCQLL